jgi:hypothetical protein
MKHGPRAHPVEPPARATRGEAVCIVLQQRAMCWRTHLEPNPWLSQRLCTAMADGEEAWAATLQAVCAGCRPVYTHTHDRCS